MNIILVSNDFPPALGGIAAHVYELAKALHLAGHEITVITRRKPDSPAVDANEGFAIHRIKLYLGAPFYGMQIWRFVKKLLPSIQPDIIHIHGMAPLSGYNPGPVPLAYTNHTSGYLKRIKKGGWRRIFLLKRQFSRIDLFLAPSRELLETPFAIRARKQFIPNGVDSVKYRFRPDERQRLRAELGILENETAAIVTRRLVDKNGVIFLAQAARFLTREDIKFIIIGNGAERTAIESEFQRHCGGRAIFLGEKKHEEITSYYSAADFSILPSLMEATSISGLEAMSTGLPLIGTKVGGIPELITDGENGYLCAPASPEDLAQKINFLLSGDLRTMGRKSRKRVEEEFDWRKIAGKTVDAYRTILPAR